MISSVYFNNFKSLIDFSLDFNEMSVLVGKNAMGKSTILQAIDFACGSAKEDFGIMLERRRWTVENIRSKLTSSNRITFRLNFSLADDKGVSHSIEWNMELNAFTSKNEMVLFSEKIIADTNDVLLDYQSSKNYLTIQMPNRIMHVQEGVVFSYNSSILKNLRNDKKKEYRLELLVSALDKFRSFDLLTPDNMRLSSRGTSEMIEASGRNLPAFIKKFSSEQKENFIIKVRWFFEGKVSDVTTETKGRPGWTQINVDEKFGTSSLKISSKEMSDGMIRILGLIAITEAASQGSIILLDEIENGINSEYADKIMRLIEDACKNKHIQMIITTHSTVMMDYVNPDDIFLVYRNRSGATKVDKAVSQKAFIDKLEYMYPGEVILNTDFERNDD